MGKGVNLNPRAFVDTPVCDLCFEDALEVGRKKSDGLKPQDFKETSIRFCIDGLYKWYKSFARHYGKSSVYVMARDVSWYWASFCGTDPTMVGIVREYYSLLKDITENTPYADLAERMDEAERIKEVGKRSYTPFSIAIPSEAHGIIADCAGALGTNFSLFYQVGMGRALSANRQGLYSFWVDGKFNLLWEEVMSRSEKRLQDLLEIRNTMDFRGSLK